MGKIRDFFTDKAFFRKVFAIALPMVIQNGVTNLVGVLDNIMVGRISSEATSGVAIVNQFMFVFYLITFGAVSAAGIFTAQYHGKGDVENVRATFRAKLLVCGAASVFGILIFIFCGGFFIKTFLTDTGADIDPALTFSLGSGYMAVMLFGILPYSLSQAFASTLRETGRTVPPMAASSAAVAVNLVLNYVLIFGKFGAPRLGVVGAAIATVVSRYAEFFILLIWTAASAGKSPFIKGVFRRFRIPGKLIRNIAVMGMPLMLNEAFWSLAVTLRNQSYSTRGLESVTAVSISSTFTNFFSVVYFSLGGAVAVIIGNLLGAGEIEEAKRTDKKLIAFSLMTTSAVAVVLASLSPLFPKFYNTTEGVASLTTYMLIVYAILMPFDAFAHCAYFTLRSGGKVFITVLFDSVFMWSVIVPACVILSRFTPVDIRILFAAGQGLEILKALLGLLILRRGTWAVRLVKD
ncbi:MAG: MATE family efflux transporter [Clostridia bacterium]|nr:MATE family efflux transporter [Clostridia bacterium]